MDAVIFFGFHEPRNMIGMPFAKGPAISSLPEASNDTVCAPIPMTITATAIKSRPQLVL